MTDVLIEPAPEMVGDDPGGFDFPDLAPGPPDDTASASGQPGGDSHNDAGEPARNDGDDRQDRRPGRHRQRAERTLIRRAVKRSRSLAAADPDDLHLLATILGSGLELAAHLWLSSAAGVPGPPRHLRW